MKEFLRTEKVYTILELNSIVRNLIRDEFPEYIWVCGEIQDYKLRKRHIYFNLIQKHPEVDEIIAQVKAIIFEDIKPRIFNKLKESEDSFELKDDIEVKFLCKVDFYPKWGEYRLIVIDVDPVYTLGKVAQNRRRLIEDLKKRGLLEKNKLLPFPLLPLNIGLITSYDSAAYHDFINELQNSGYGFKIFAYSSYMQGKFVERDVLHALDFFNSYRDFLDIIVIIRGGGSTADLSWFDNKRIAEAIAFSRIPVISGLGHEINTTITDLVVHTSLKTPTKAAQFLIEKVRVFLEQIQYFQEAIINEVESWVRREKEKLLTLTVKFESGVLKYFKTHHTNLAEIKNQCLGLSSSLINSKAIKLFQEFKFLKIYMDNFFKKRVDLMSHIKEKINLLDPKNILKRGYSITFKDSRVIKEAKELKKGDSIRTVFFQGSVLSLVEERREKGE